ncbi:proton channel OTOP2-like isoform X2 [Rana temporaria]|nr:proton channel OTOP2-like isoform X2 [Rana temporaria]
MGDNGVDDNSTVKPTSSEPDEKFEKSSIDHNIPTTANLQLLRKKGSRLFSGIIGLNVMLLSCVLVSSAAFGDIAVIEREVLSLLCVLMGLTACWMIVYLTWTARKKNYRNLKDSHAGPIWLRMGLASFGACSFVMVVLKICKSVNLISCESPIKIVHPVFQGVFLVIQTYFLWVYSKDCVQVQMNFTRFGLMLTLITNLSIWIAAVTDELLHQTPSEGGHRLVKAAPSGCSCDSAVCKSFETGYWYLYPFNIEYSLFASALSYVMWKNVGRTLDNDSHSSHHSVRLPRLFVGVILGVGVFIAGLVIFIIYEIEISSETKEQVLKMFYIFHIVAFALMSLACVAGSIIFRFEERDADSHKNPTRSLDVGLLIIAALGKFIIQYFSVIAVIATAAKELRDVLNLVYSILMIVQLTVQNIFIIEGIHRQAAHDEHEDHDNAVEHNGRPEIYVNTVATDSQDNHLGAEHGHEVDANPHSSSRRTRKNWNRRIVKELSLFLLFSNIIFWIIPAFGARPKFDNDRELNFYGNTMWTSIVNIGLPFGIFYRMHAVASLFEVYVLS